MSRAFKFIGKQSRSSANADSGRIWCTGNAGEARSVPENGVEIEGDACATERDYNSTELVVEVGEAVSVEFEKSGWA